MDKIEIEAWEYHARMLNDEAVKNKAALLLYYDPTPDKDKNKTLKAINGSGKSMLIMLASLIDQMAEDTGVRASSICREVSMMVRARELVDKLEETIKECQDGGQTDE